MNIDNVKIMHKSIVGNFVLFFMLITLILSVSFAFYYLSPRNYTLYEYDNKTNKKTLTENFVIKPKEEIILTYKKYKNNLLKIITDKESLCLTFTNFYKSENVVIDSNSLIKLNESDIVIKNNSNNNMDIKVELYNIKSN
jgi:hypothetical protein